MACWFSRIYGDRAIVTVAGKIRKRLDDQWTRRKYPDDHGLFLRSAVDQIKMVRNYASLAIWCGGNEITPPEDILTALRDTILPKLDNTRWFVDYSNSDSMSHNVLGGNGDGPYGIQPSYQFSGSLKPFLSIPRLVR
jgi:hypothetical protein